MDILRNLLRRKLRNSLTILGIVAGALALTVMGALSEKIAQLVDGALQYYGTRVVVQSQAFSPGQILGPPFSLGVAAEIRELPGVEGVSPTVTLPYVENQNATPMIGVGLPILIVGVEPQFFTSEAGRAPVLISRGSALKAGEHRVAVVGTDFARSKGLRLGDSFAAKGVKFRVVGVMEKTLTIRDSFVLVPLKDAQELLASSLSELVYPDPYILVTQLDVYPEHEKDADALAKTITEEVGGVRAFPPSATRRYFRHSLLIFNLIVFSSTIIAMFVGGLAILNTMLMAVSERMQEIALKRALGAGTWDIVREFVAEAGVMGFLGGVFGLAGGCLLVSFLNSETFSEGIVIFLVTPRLALLVPSLSTLLGLAFGLYPAISAARKNPIEGLRRT